MSNYLRGTTVETSLSSPMKNKKSTNRDRAVSYNKGQVQNVKSARVYVFGESNVHEDELENGDVEMTSIRSRTKDKSSNSSQQNDEPIYFDREITDGDSLQSLSVQFSCPISELKRINHLIQDQDFFGLKYVKVPVLRYGILSEQIEQLKAQTPSSSGASYNGDLEPLIEIPNSYNYNYDDTDSAQDFSDPEMQMKIMRTLSIKENLTNNNEEAEAFLKSMDKDLERVRNYASKERGSLSEVISVLTNKSVFPLRAKKREHLNGADCGIRWWSVLLVILFFVVILPLGYVIYHYYGKS
ncbi:hypothetical protein SNE40_012378 [Patella caerulea]|uniref:LysM domain-containing protein n=1 Tax=Patella caerulea TaxID=87958 RepID=A0AAN8JRH4_PATCE